MNKIQSYNEIIYDSRPVKYTEFISDKYNLIHQELYLDALNKAISDYIKFNNQYENINEFKQNVNIVEVKNNEYWQPSYTIWRTKIYPYKILTKGQFADEHKIPNSKYIESDNPGAMSLEYWWNMYQKFEDKNINNIKISNDNLNDYVLINLNYVTGIATLRSKLTYKEIEVPFEYLDENIDIDDSMLLDHTFGALWKNKYGNE